MTTEFWIDPTCVELFRNQGLETFSAWMHGEMGEVVSQARTSEVRRIKAGDEVFFLKRRRGERWSDLAELMLFGRKPMGGAMREFKALEALAAKGFAVMQAVARGERRQWGMPCEGFLMVRAVPGRLAADIYQEGPAEARVLVLDSVGRLTGQLHAAGFFDHVRLKDLIDCPARGLVLIDRESRHPWARRFSRRTALRSLARTVRRTARDGVRFSPAAARAYLSAYREGVAACWKISPQELRRLVFQQIRRELTR